MGKEEDVEVPAGKYRAVRIDVEIESPGRAGETTRSSIWYAPRVGVVRQVHGEPDTGYVKVLKSFKSGK